MPRCRGSRMPRPPPPGHPPPCPLFGAPCGTRGPWKSFQDSDRLHRGCSRQTKHSLASKSAQLLPPPWPRTPALPRPASLQHQQAALASSTHASGQQPASGGERRGQREAAVSLRGLQLTSVNW
jgi:hypothetical protein